MDATSRSARGWAAAPRWAASSARKNPSTVWDDAVNVASRMESTGAEGKIQVSQDVHACLKDAFVLEEPGGIDVKGKGIIRTWFLVGRKPLPTVHQQHAQGSQSVQACRYPACPTHDAFQALPAQPARPEGGLRGSGDAARTVQDPERRGEG